MVFPTRKQAEEFLRASNDECDRSLRQMNLNDEALIKAARRSYARQLIRNEDDAWSWLARNRPKDFWTLKKKDTHEASVGKHYLMAAVRAHVESQCDEW